MKKTLTALACLTLATPAIAADTIKIGLGVPMTGDYAPYSEWQGARCMAEKNQRWWGRQRYGDRGSGSGFSG